MVARAGIDARRLVLFRRTVERILRDLLFGTAGRRDLVARVGEHGPEALKRHVRRTDGPPPWAAGRPRYQPDDRCDADVVAQEGNAAAAGVGHVDAGVD